MDVYRRLRVKFRKCKILNDNISNSLSKQLHEFFREGCLETQVLTCYGVGETEFVGVQNADLAEIEHYAQIPDRVDVLITHRPPLGIFDSVGNGVRYGSAALLEKVKSVKPKLHLFGHVHGAYGKQEWNGTLFCNSGVTDWRYNLIYTPQVLEV